jgi:DNA/RNA-binding domain of Phe-tRNA-synthetase-like protein
MLQESENLELSRTARLVGNFANEKELFFMMGKFTPQLKELPGGVDMGAPHAIESRTPAAWLPAAGHQEDRAEHLRAAQSLLEREIARTDLAPAESEALREVLYALRERNLARVGSVYRDAFSEMKTQTEATRQAFEHLEKYFAR